MSGGDEHNGIQRKTVVVGEPPPFQPVYSSIVFLLDHVSVSETRVTYRSYGPLSGDRAGLARFLREMADKIESPAIVVPDQPAIILPNQ